MPYHSCQEAGPHQKVEHVLPSLGRLWGGGRGRGDKLCTSDTMLLHSWQKINNKSLRKISACDEHPRKRLSTSEWGGLKIPPEVLQTGKK